ncbi:MAG: LemA family protein [Rhodocyclaceae bacterium]|jgi:LemA protein|nr:LemA family protein [Rhodocyclaceae bacterium]MCL4756743.1 LemA family protein [Rhodocyclaceae bacterium]
MELWIVIGIVVALAVYVVIIYNGLVELRNRVKNAFSQIDVQLQRRYDLIPNLVETAKGYMAHERETLEAVIQARNAAQAASRRAENDPADGAAMRDLMGAEQALGGLLTRFFALAEAYPDLKANQNMAQLQEELASTENRIAFSRQAYNDAVTAYNIKREQFPDSLVANNFGFKPAEQWQMDDTAARAPVKVSFGQS